MITDRLPALFRIDTVANVVLGVATLALVAAPGLLGLPRPVLAVGGLLMLANAVDLHATARATVPEPARVQRSAAIDVVFGVALLAVAAVGLAGQSDAARWTLAAVGDVSLAVAAGKLLGARRVRAMAPQRAA